MEVVKRVKEENVENNLLHYLIFRYYIMTTRNQRIRAAQKRGDIALANKRIKQKKFVDDNPVGQGCENCPEHCTAALCGDKCADECYKKPDPKIHPSRRDSDSSDSDDSSVNTGQPKYGGRKTRRKRRKKRRKSRKMRKKTKRRRKRRRKKSKKVRRK